MFMSTNHKLVLILTWVLLSYSGRGETPPNDSIIPGDTLTSNKAYISFEGFIDPNVIHNHNIKMKFSTPRHTEGYDPTLSNPLKYTGLDKEEEDMDLRPTLIYIVTRRLSNHIFSSLVSKLPIQDAINIMEWSDSKRLHDLEPDCTSSEDDGGNDIYHAFVDNKNIDDEIPEDKLKNLLEKQRRKDICHVDFHSLKPFYGIEFKVHITFTTVPMDTLKTSRDILSRVTPDHRGWTSPITNTYFSFSVTIDSPDFDTVASRKIKRPILLGNGTIVPWDVVHRDEPGVEEIARSFIELTSHVLGADLENLKQNILKDYDQIIAKRFPLHSEMLEMERNLESSSDVDDIREDDYSYGDDIDEVLSPNVRKLCLEHGLDLNSCIQVQIQLLETENDNDSHNYDERSTTVSSGNDSMLLEDELTSNLIAEDVGDKNYEWGLSRDELVQLRNDMIDMESLVDQIENEEY